ncbi:ExeM/NucH family extracellular endonuclease [Marinobacter sp. BGYM27]|uniref:ExeM/NucH family extracellular endonuclease n=1 Tax=Marinobacter sp. BGYM27 TaxID=2975597 RepID=UPI0021A417D5|nr:ExeM/NucH family extracellular endonuclease [Marinobacter sp. BGYM27]MDG5500092.1 ExeM/NucH family extracellular endonuclease [Marinobacter sp. BGYM27]
MLSRITALLLCCSAPFAVVAQCGDPYTPVAGIQGEQDASPLAGQSVVVEGVMTLDSRSKDGLSGFYMQASDEDVDDSSRTSEAVFVHTKRAGGQVGHRVRIKGQVKEYYGLTEVTRLSSLMDCGAAALPAPVMLSFPLPGASRLESLEAMRVRFSAPLTVVDVHDLGRFGVVALAATDQWQKDNSEDSTMAGNAITRILLDDASNRQNPDGANWLGGQFRADRLVRAGSQLESVSGILDFRYKAWRIQPDRPPVVVDRNPRPAAPRAPVDGSLRVASFNVLNFFNGDGKGGGFPTARGADNRQELLRQQAKLVSALQQLKADVVGLMELENDGSGPESAIAELTQALGAPWTFVYTGNRVGRDAIQVGIIYRADRVTPVGDAVILNDGPFARFSRPPVVQRFRAQTSDFSFRVMVNHFKSRSCRNAKGDNSDQHDGEGCYAPARRDAARSLVNWLASASPREATLLLGDLNSYAGESPLTILAAGGYRQPMQGSNPSHYTYRFFGVKGSLDYVLADTASASRLTGVGVWHINADEPPMLDYNLEHHPEGRADRLYQAAPWRSSDHDPIYVDINTGP